MNKYSGLTEQDLMALIGVFPAVSPEQIEEARKLIASFGLPIDATLVFEGCMDALPRSWPRSIPIPGGKLTDLFIQHYANACSAPFGEMPTFAALLPYFKRLVEFFCGNDSLAAAQAYGEALLLKDAFAKKSLKTINLLGRECKFFSLHSCYLTSNI